MGYLFFDIETYVDKENPTSGLNPHMPESKVIAIAYNSYDTFVIRTDLREKTSPTILKEWELGEKEILSDFFDFWKMRMDRDEHLKICGFNHTKFDAPYLSSRLIINDISDPYEIHEYLYQRPHYIDLAQIGMITSGRMAKRKEFYNVGQKEINKFFGIPVKEASGKDVSRWYDREEYDKIEDYIKTEFTFEELYVSLRNHIKYKETFTR